MFVGKRYFLAPVILSFFKLDTNLVILCASSGYFRCWLRQILYDSYDEDCRFFCGKLNRIGFRKVAMYVWDYPHHKPK